LFLSIFQGVASSNKLLVEVPALRHKPGDSVRKKLSTTANN
jgi:hypothetical protein